MNASCDTTRSPAPSEATTGPAGAALAAGPDVALADRLLAPAHQLPPRAEVVALADRLSVAASRHKQEPAHSGLVFRAAQLRERLWRFDRVASDAREALELYQTVMEAAAGTARGCQADRRRALLLGEFELDASRAYRELYLARQRQESVPGSPESPARRTCLERIRSALQNREAYRPHDAAWQQLVEAGERAAVAYRRQAVGEPQLAVSGPPASSLAPPGDAGLPVRNIVVAPDDSRVGKEPVQLSAVQPYSWEHGGRVVLTLSAPARYDLAALPPDPTADRGHRVYLDVARARIKDVPRTVEAGGLIQRIRLGKRKDGTRVVIDLAARAFPRVFYLPEPFRVVIDLNTRPPVTERPSLPRGQRSIRRVTLDPGHGGWDAGAVGPTGLQEKDVVLDVAHRAAPALAHELRIETMLTRDDDSFIPLEERTARANAFHADLFVSIHCNATEDGFARGAQFYVLDPSREIDALALRVAMRENALSAGGQRTYDPREIDAQITAVATGLNVGDVAQRSGHFADLLRQAAASSLTARFGVTAQARIRTGAFFVLLGADMPAVLFETAFISNPEDEAQLATADFRQKLADSIVNAVRAYREGR